jgi:hypothetical protein
MTNNEIDQTSLLDTQAAALGKGHFAVGKGFAECHTRQRAYGKKTIGKAVFTECLLSDTRQG